MSIHSYNKPVLSLDDQVSYLKSQGLIIADGFHAKHFLKFANYYRVSGYAQFFYDDSHKSDKRKCFKPGASFQDLIQLYDFDRHLRLLVMDALERIEVAVRSQICFYLIKIGS